MMFSIIRQLSHSGSAGCLTHLLLKTGSSPPLVSLATTGVAQKKSTGAEAGPWLQAARDSLWALGGRSQLRQRLSGPLSFASKTITRLKFMASS